MTLPSIMSKPMTVKRYPTVSDHGRGVTDYSAEPATHVVYGDAQPEAGETDAVNRDGAEANLVVWLQPGSDVRDADLVEVRGRDYQVLGLPERWRSGVLDHDVVRLSRWEG